MGFIPIPFLERKGSIIIYISVKKKFIFTIIITILWTIICSFIEIPWFRDLQAEVGTFIAFLIVICLACIPGIMICLVLTGIILDKPRRREIIEEDLTDITILIAAYNEEKTIYDTISSLSKQYYPKNLFIKIIDNNSKDNTKQEIERGIQDFPNLNLEYMFESKQGKFAALNHGLKTTTTPYVITIDADTYLYKNAVLNLANAICQESKTKDVGAIAGTVLVKNSRDNLLAGMQEWEYFLSIAAIKRMQGLFQSTLVAQGAFSIYNTEKVKQVGGWPDSIGEDIVVTWKLLEKGERTYYEDQAIAFTNVPTDFTIFSRQRARWARGMIEGFRHYNRNNNNNFYSRFFIFCDYFLFIIDFGVTFIYIPGIILALFFHKWLIVGPMTLLLLPLTLLLFLVMFLKEYYAVFKPLGLKIRKNFLALIAYVLFYSILLSPFCIKGYCQEFLGAKRKWK